MKIAVFLPTNISLSVQGYVNNIVHWLNQMDVEISFFEESDLLPDNVDLYWDPRAGRPGPYKKILQSNKPCVVTFHGAAHLVLDSRECFDSRIINRTRGLLNRIKTRFEWIRVRHTSAKIITVSNYAKREAQQVLHLKADNIFPVYHGVDLETFFKTDDSYSDTPYLLHVSSFQPLKNLDRIIDAHAKLPDNNKPTLIAVVPGYPQSASVPEGIEIIRTPKNHQELAELYRGALALIFPSLRETFGMPIVEAMACGCPVITSNITACPEIAGEAALLVNPRSVDDIASAMKRIVTEGSLRNELREKGLLQVLQFTWQRSAEEHLKVFNSAVQEAGVP